MEALINRSVACEQKLGYDCKRSRSVMMILIINMKCTLDPYCTQRIRLRYIIVRFILLSYVIINQYCKRSRLLNTPVGDSDNFSPYGYWVSRQNKVMDYWAGSLPGNILILFSHNTLATNLSTFQVLKL